MPGAGGAARGPRGKPNWRLPAAAPRVQHRVQAKVYLLLGRLAIVSDKKSHHVAARKEKKLEAMRAALGLDDEVGQKKSSQVDSDPESGELVPGKAGF
ncbi:hypothetical protein TRIUR3_10861 [Triticum urartu]|uniref:Uncharacterized protein n=1 Tax=Triticum urartu TaxID=4572 RepID=M7ZA03_TRIUA|nr:hypothetical protein TRIUR3_10861 [Triticum urartu]